MTFSDTMEQLQELNHRHALQPGAVATNPPPAGDHDHPSFSNSSRVSMAHLLVPNQQELYMPLHHPPSVQRALIFVQVTYP